MALLSASSVAICLASSIFIWMMSGWSDGMTFAQISGVFCCLLAFMDDPVPAMRKFIDVSALSVVVAFIYAFAVLPIIDDFISLIAVLGLFLIPSGICLAVPSLAIVGMGLCINFPLLLTLQAKQQSDFLIFTNAGAATIMAMIWTVVVRSIFRSVKAETNARRMLSAADKHFKKITLGKYINADRTHNHMIDLASLFVSRATKIPSSDIIANTDLIRGLRISVHLIKMQELASELPINMLQKLNTVLEQMHKINSGATLHNEQFLKPVLITIDDLINFGLNKAKTKKEDELLLQTVAVRLALMPNAKFPVLEITQSVSTTK
ncbi:FUSC family protein [Brucellaceae bacterium C25G]